MVAVTNFELQIFSLGVWKFVDYILTRAKKGNRLPKSSSIFLDYITIIMSVSRIMCEAHKFLN